MNKIRIFKDDVVEGDKPVVLKAPRSIRRGDPEDYEALVAVEGHGKFTESLVDFYIATVGSA